MWVRHTLLATVLFFFLGVEVEDAFAEQRRVALVIGNSTYENAGQLQNPTNDANDVAAQLKQLGFEVILGTNLDKARMDKTVRDFAESLNGAAVSLFFYAGHGLQVDGENYIVPIDAKLTSAASLDFEMVRLNLIQRSMERETRTSIVILDACRDNPLARNLARALGTRSVAIGRGLARVESGEGTLISFSTQPGNVAADGSGRNSPFAAALLNNISKVGDDLSSILINVRNDVMKATARKQVPWENSALTAKFYFVLPPPSGPSNEQIELEFWASVKDSANPEVLRTYLSKYPQGAFTPVAEALIKQFEQQMEAARATREEERKRQEEENKTAELRRMEEERKLQAASLADERRRAEDRKNTAEVQRLEQQRRTEELQHAQELRKALEEIRAAREAAKAAEEQRLAALHAADDARKLAAQSGPSNAPISETAAKTEAETAFWTSVKESTNPSILQSYLERYPDGIFAPLAKALIQQYVQQREAQKAGQEAEKRRQDEEKKLAEVQKLENERNARDAANAEEKSLAENKKNLTELHRLQEKQHTDELKHAEELRKVQEEVRLAREAATKAEERRLAAEKAANQARGAATEAGEAAEKERASKSRSASLEKPQGATSSGAFDGVWNFDRSVTLECGVKGSHFVVRVQGGAAYGPGGRGTVSPDGAIYVPGRANSFSGRLRGNSGSGTYSGRCSGTFTASRN